VNPLWTISALAERICILMASEYNWDRPAHQKKEPIKIKKDPSSSSYDW